VSNTTENASNVPLRGLQKETLAMLLPHNSEDAVVRMNSMLPGRSVER